MGWLPLGGHNELNEDPEQAALREAKEASGLKVELLGGRPLPQGQAPRQGLDDRRFRYSSKQFACRCDCQILRQASARSQAKPAASREVLNHRAGLLFWVNGRIICGSMRPIRDTLKEFRTRPWRYWLGWDESFTYELANGRVFRVSASGRHEVLVFSEIQAWKKNSKFVTIYQEACTRIIWDRSNELGSVLERELPEKWVIETEDK